MATINSSIVIISLPAIFRGVKLNPLGAGNVSYLLWMLMGYLLVSAVLVVSLGRLGDIYGRVRIYNAGFLVFSLASVFLALDPLTSGNGALWLIAGRVIQGIGGAMLMANSSAIVTDAFPSNQRGFALGINMVAGLSGSFIGLVAGGLLSEVRLAAGVLGQRPVRPARHRSGPTAASRRSAPRTPSRIDWWGNLTFAVGLSALLSGITYGIQPYGGHNMGWTNPWVAGRADRRRRDARRVLLRRDQGRGADVPPRAVQGTGLRRRQLGDVPVLDRPRWPAVHAHHLAAGHLAPAARLLVREHSAVGRHLPAAADRSASSSPARCPATCPTSSAPGPSPAADCCWWR